MSSPHPYQDAAALAFPSPNTPPPSHAWKAGQDALDVLQFHRPAAPRNGNRQVPATVM